MDRIPWQDSIAPLQAYLRCGGTEDSVQDSAQDSLLLRSRLNAMVVFVIANEPLLFLRPQDSLLLRSWLNATVRLTMSASPSPLFCSCFEVQPGSCLYPFPFVSHDMLMNVNTDRCRQRTGTNMYKQHLHFELGRSLSFFLRNVVEPWFALADISGSRL